MSKNEFIKLLENVKSKSEIARRLGYAYYNGKVTKEIKEALAKYELSFDDIILKPEKRKCLNCGNELLKN